MLRTSERYSRFSARLAERAVAQARRAPTAAAAALVIAQHQATQANEATAAITAMLAEQRIAEPPVAPLVAVAFTTGAAEIGAMLSRVEVDWQFNRLVSSLVQDAGRAAQLVDVTTRPDIRHVRHLNLPSCSRCAVLAGRVYRYSTGFKRHPQCFPAGTVVSGPGAHGATRRWYEGELVTVRTAGGKEFSATRNHPILTAEGWLPAHLLREGGNVVSRAGGDRSRALLVPNHDQMPTRIEDLWRSERMGPLGRVPVAAEDFHGDGLGSSHVDVVLADRLLGSGKEAAFFEQAGEQGLPVGSVLSIPLSDPRASFEVGMTGLAPATSVLSGGGLPLSLHRGLLAGPEQAGFAGVPDGHLRLDQATPDQFPRVPGALGDGVLTLAREVGGDDGGAVHRESLPTRWDAPAVPFSLENSGTYAGPGLDLRNRLAGQVELDRVVKVTRVSWSGHVYNLTSSEGWYDANGVIVSNCDCVMIPTTVAAPDLTYDPQELVRTGQITGLSKADRQAIEDGADLGQVTNIRRRSAGLMDSGEALTRGSRPTPAGIYRMAGDDRDRALSLLADHGYIRP